MTTSPPDIETLKSRMRANWMAGDFGVIARSGQRPSEELIERLQLAPGTRVLDVACGTGNSALPAARAGAEVIGIDIAPNLLEQARARAAEEGLQARFEEGDAEQLAFPDASIDVIVSVFGAMFAPRPERVVTEFLRVVRPGGRIAMASWTREGFNGKMFATSARHVPPPPGLQPPVLWGDEATVRQRFGAGVSDLQMNRRIAVLAFPFDPVGTVEHFRRYFGPMARAFETLDDAAQQAYRRDLEMLWTEHNRATDGTTEVHAEYLEVVATRA